MALFALRLQSGPSKRNSDHGSAASDRGNGSLQLCCNEHCGCAALDKSPQSGFFLKRPGPFAVHLPFALSPDCLNGSFNMAARRLIAAMVRLNLADTRVKEAPPSSRARRRASSSGVQGRFAPWLIISSPSAPARPGGGWLRSGRADLPA